MNELIEELWDSLGLVTIGEFSEAIQLACIKYLELKK